MSPWVWGTLNCLGFLPAKVGFTVVHMENNTIITTNNTRINCMSHAHSCKPTFVPPCTLWDNECVLFQVTKLFQ